MFLIVKAFHVSLQIHARTSRPFKPCLKAKDKPCFQTGKLATKACDLFAVHTNKYNSSRKSS